MKIFVKVKAGKREAIVKKLDDIHFELSVKARPEQGKANAEVVAALAQYFHVPSSRVRIISGHTARRKLVEIGR